LKKLFLILIFITGLNFLTSLNLFAQRKDTSDYFAVGIFGGTYIGQSPPQESNRYLNSAALEFEYFKFRELSFYLQGLYEFTESDRRPPFIIPLGYPVRHVHEPDSYRINISFGGRYYLRNKDINPFFQLGLNHETNYIGRYNSYEFSDGEDHSFQNGYYFYRLSVNLGVGLSIKLSNLFKLEFKYDLYRSIVNSGHRDGFTGFSFLGGLKYNL